MAPTEIVTGKWEELLDAEPEVLAEVERMGGSDPRRMWRLLDLAAGYVLELRARVQELEREREEMRQRIVELTPAANRWVAVRRTVSKFFRDYTNDHRHEKFSPGRPDPAVIADDIADRIRGEQ